MKLTMSALYTPINKVVVVFTEQNEMNNKK